MTAKTAQRTPEQDALVLLRQFRDEFISVRDRSAHYYIDGKWLAQMHALLARASE